MVGYGTNKGIVPVSCDAIFKKIDEMKAGPDANKFQYQVITGITTYPIPGDNR